MISRKLGKPTMRRRPFLSVLSVLTASVLTGCGGDSGSGGPGGGETGTVVVDGSSTVYRISRAAQLGFKKLEPDIKILVGNHGTGGGFGRYLQGEVDIIDASRDAKPEEESQAKEKGLEWTRFLVGYDGITVVVNPKNDFVKSLTVEQLKRLFAPDSTVTTWKQLDPSWPDRKIVLYAPDTDSGTFEFFTEEIVGKDVKTQRPDVQVSPDDNTLVTGVKNDVDGLGYFGYAYFAANQEKLRAVPIQKDAQSQPVEPNLASILSKEYAPLSRPLYIFVKNASIQRPAVAKFVQYYLANIDKLASDGGYVPPTKDDQAANQAALESLTPPSQNSPRKTAE